MLRRVRVSRTMAYGPGFRGNIGAKIVRKTRN
jgi:hypothetical protein